MIAFENPDNDVFTLHILDLNGKLVQVMEDIRDNVIRLNRGSLEAGIYFLELYGRNTFRGKLVVK